MFSDRKAPKSDRKATKSGRKIRFSFFMNFFEFLNFETEKFEISPEFVSRTQPVTVNFPVNRIYRPNFFSLDTIRFRFRRGHQHRSTASRPPSPHFPLSAPIGRSMARRGFPVASPHRWAAQLLLDSARLI